MQASVGAFAVRALVAIALIGLAALLWQVSDVLVPIFAGMVLAVVLRSCTRLVMRLLPVPPIVALLLAILLLLILLALVGLLIGTRASTQFDQLAQTLPAAWDRMLARLQGLSAGRSLLGMLRSQSSSAAWLPRIQAMATVTFGALVDAILILFTGLFLAANPELYRRGLLSLIPRTGRPQVARALDAAVAALGQWLKGVLLSMLCIGLITGLGLWALGIPLALTLGILSGLTEFIPYLGPVLGAIPAVLVAFSVGPSHALEVVLLYLGVHLIEGNLLVPLIQRWAVALPPALAIIAVVVFGQLFGLIGIVFATPMTVVTLALVDTLYVQSALKSRSGQ